METVFNHGLCVQFRTENFREFSEAKVHWSLSLSVQGLLKAKVEPLVLAMSFKAVECCQFVTSLGLYLHSEAVLTWSVWILLKRQLSKFDCGLSRILVEGKVDVKAEAC